MNSVILQIASRYLKGLLLIFAVLALFRGHNYPGGGFIGGLMAGLALVYEGLAFNAFQVKERLVGKPERFIAGGLFVLFLSFLPPVFKGYEFMAGVWVKIPLPLGQEIKLGTPFLFDTGVFLTVIGVTLLFIFSLTQKN